MNNKQDTTCSFNKRSVFDRFIPTNGHWDLAKLEEELQGMWNARTHCVVCYRKWHHVYKYVINIVDQMTSVAGNWQMFDEHHLEDELQQLPW